MSTRYTFEGDNIKVSVNGLSTQGQVKRLEVVIPDTVSVKAGPIADAPTGYQSEIAQVLLNGAPQYKDNGDGTMTYVPTGAIIKPTTPTLKSRYKNSRELLDDVSAQNYTRKVIVDGTPLEFTQFGGEPAAYYGSEAGSGDLLALEVPALPPTVAINTLLSSTLNLGPTVFEVSSGDKNGRVFLAGGAGIPYVAHLSAAGLKDGAGHFSLSEVPGAATVARTREIALDGKVVEARGLPSVSSDVTYAVKSGRFVTVNDAPANAGVIEASWVGDQSAPFFVEHHPPQ